MYSEQFCEVYNLFGWNYFPEAFGEQLLLWLDQHQIKPENSMDLACGTGILCDILSRHGITASGMDFSEGMIEVARREHPQIFFEVADMITYRPDTQYDLVTCTGDALNHIIELDDVKKIFENVYAYTKNGGYFIFDILNKNEISTEEPFDLDFSDTVRARFQMTLDEQQIVRLTVAVYENDMFQFKETITETVHDPEVICKMLSDCGFDIIKCADQLPDDIETHATTWFIIAHKPV